MIVSALLSVWWFVTTVMAILFTTMFAKSCYDRSQGIPPGPQWIPVIGTVAKLSQDFHRSIYRLSRTYGDVFAMYIGSKRIVFVNDSESAKEVLISKSAEFGSRPDPRYDYIGYLRKKWQTQPGIAFGEFTDTWKIQRKFSHTVLRSFGLGKSSFQDQIMLHVKDLSDIMFAKAGKPVEMSDCISNCVANVICSIVFNHKYDYGDAKFQGFISKVNDFFYVSSLLRMTPYFFVRPLWGYASRKEKLALRFQESIASVQSFCEDHIREHLSTLDADNVRDFIDVYLLECQKENNDPVKGFNHDQLVSILFDLFLAGVETTASTLQWAFLFMIREPEVQEKVYEEIVGVLEGSRDSVVWEDRASLPYTCATIMEIQRLGNVAPFTLPHAATCDTSVAGHRVIKGDVVLVNLWAIHTDPRLWREPMSFMPQRFLDASSGDVQKISTFLPFSAGRRVCLGEQLAKMEMFLFFTNVLLKFRLQRVVEHKPPDLDSTCGLTLQPKPYQFVAEPRGNTIN